MKNVIVNFGYYTQAVAGLADKYRNANERLIADERFRDAAVLSCECDVHIRIAAKDVREEMDIRTALSTLVRLVKAYSAADHLYSHRDTSDAMKAIHDLRDALAGLYTALQIAIEDADYPRDRQTRTPQRPPKDWQRFYVIRKRGGELDGWPTAIKVYSDHDLAIRNQSNGDAIEQIDNHHILSWGRDNCVFDE